MSVPVRASRTSNALTRKPTPGRSSTRSATGGDGDPEVIRDANFTRVLQDALRSAFPGITETDRLRVNADITLRNEIIRSVFWDLSVYGTWDNRPAAGAAEEDYGVVTSLGASF